METVSLALIIVGLAIIAVVLLMRWRLRQRQSMPPRPSVMPTREEPVDFDPLFAIDRARDARRELNELPPVHAESDEATASMTRSARSVIEPAPGDALPPPERVGEPARGHRCPERVREDRDGDRGPGFRRRRHRRGGSACGPRIGDVVVFPLLPA